MMGIRAAAAFLSLALLAACATKDKEPGIKIQEAKVAVAVHCNPDLGREPDYPDTAATLVRVPHPDAVARLKANPADVAALTDEIANLGYQARLLLKGRLMRIQRDGEKSAALAGCKGPPQ
jgi:hypothetical protein